jgi:hypothetical protein
MPLHQISTSVLFFRILDKVTLWSQSSPPKYQGTTYSTPLTWRAVLPGIHSYAVTPYAFSYPSGGRALSYVAELQSVTTSTGILDVSAYGSLGQLSTISFTIMIITASNLYVELLIAGKYPLILRPPYGRFWQHDKHSLRHSPHYYSFNAQF